MESIQEVVAEKVKGKPGRKPKPVEGVDLSALLETVMEQNRLLIEQMGRQNAESSLALAAELRKPTELEQKKLDEEKESIRKRAEMAVVAAKQAEAGLLAKQSRCPHSDPNGITTFVTQVYSDGYWKPFCSRCQLALPKIKATDEEKMGGVNLRTWQNVTEAGLTQMAILREPKVA